MKPLPFILDNEAYRGANVVFFKQKQLLTTLKGMPIVSSPSLCAIYISKRASCIYNNESKFTNARHVLGL